MKKILKISLEGIITVLTIILILIDRLLLFPIIWKSSPSLKEYSEFSHLLNELFNRWMIILSFTAVSVVIAVIVYYLQ